MAESPPPYKPRKEGPPAIDKRNLQLYSSRRRIGEFMATTKTAAKDSIMIPALRARSNFGKLLKRVERDGRGLVIEKRGTPRAILLSIRDYEIGRASCRERV